ncbi:hypothetical protein QQ045_032587 [Rhodiola kirilowii]
MQSSSRATANPNMDIYDYLHPVPIDPSLLTMQSVHHTEAIWRNQMYREFMSDKPLRVAGHNVVNMNPRLAEYVANTEFLSLTQDVALLTGLPIDGEPVSGLGELELEPVCLSLLCEVPNHPKVKLMGSKTWFDNYLTNMPDDVDEETLKKYARVYILCLLGLTLMLDLYDDQLERIVHIDFIFRPYEEELMERLHLVCLELRELWTADVPLICFNIVEWYHPFRVMRQFGWKKMIPPTPAPIAFMNEHRGLERKNKVDWKIRTLLICASQATEGFSSTADPRPIFHRIFHTVVEELRVLGELRLLNINPDIIQFQNGDDDYMNLDDDHVTNLDSQTAGYTHPSSSRAPPSPPF